MANKPKKVEQWDLRFDDPFYVYQLLLEKIVKGRKLDDEEKEFVKSTDAKIKSGEIKIVYPNDDGYDEVVVSRLKLKYPLKFVEYYSRSNLPAWAKKLFNDIKASDLDVAEYKSIHNITMEWIDLDNTNGIAFVWENEKDKTMFLLKS